MMMILRYMGKIFSRYTGRLSWLCGTLRQDGIPTKNLLVVRCFAHKVNIELAFRCHCRSIIRRVENDEMGISEGEDRALARKKEVWKAKIELQ
jgi:hypothetical protein